jgi:hypothetical protein
MRKTKEEPKKTKKEPIKKVKKEPKETKVNFDLSELTLEELIEVYDNINIFMGYLEESKIEIEEKENEDE